jgi:hypothetical protein
VFTILGALAALGLVANALSLVQAIASLGFGMAVLVVMALWQYTSARAAKGRPLTRREQLWNAAVFLAWLAALALLGWVWKTW